MKYSQHSKGIFLALVIFQNFAVCSNCARHCEHILMMKWCCRSWPTRLLSLADCHRRMSISIWFRSETARVAVGYVLL